MLGSRGPRRPWRKQATALVERAREGPPRARAEPAGDPEILSLVDEPYDSVDGTRRRLESLEETLTAQGDDRAVFLTVYSRTTEAVADRIDRGEFEDPDWVADYLVAFANRYREAARDYEQGSMGELADPWQLAFESAAAADSLAIQDALLGVNAHINYDLAFALADVGIETDRRSKRADHRAVTDVLREIVDDIQDLLAREYAPGLEAADEALGRVGEGVAVFTIAECRVSAWRNAVALRSRFRARRWIARRVTHATATGAAYLLSARAGDAVQKTLGAFEEGAATGGNRERPMTEE